MEKEIKDDLVVKIKELLGIEAQPDVVDYVYTCAVKNNSTKETILNDF